MGSTTSTLKWVNLNTLLQEEKKKIDEKDYEKW